jgi:hypothetical protein
LCCPVAIGVALLLFGGEDEQVHDVVVGGEFSQLPRSLVAAVNGVDLGSVDD